MSMWRQVISPNEGGGMLFDVGILDDGTLHNPKGYPDDQVRAAVLAAEARRRERQHERRSAGAKKAAITRARRKEKRIAEAAKLLVAGKGIGNRSHCFVCKRGLSDPELIERGIGSECWQGVLDGAERLMCQSASSRPDHCMPDVTTDSGKVR